MKQKALAFFNNSTIDKRKLMLFERNALKVAMATFDWVNIAGLGITCVGLAVAMHKNEREMAQERREELKRRDEIWFERFEGLEERCERIEKALMVVISKIKSN